MVDLRSENVSRWQNRFEQMRVAGSPHPELGSDAVRLDSCPFTHIEIGAVVAWVLANGLGRYWIKQPGPLELAYLAALCRRGLRKFGKESGKLASPIRGSGGVIRVR